MAGELLADVVLLASDEEGSGEDAGPAAPLVASPLGSKSRNPARSYAGDDPLLVMHEDILDLWDALRPSQREHDERLKSIGVVAEALRRHFPSALVRPFGSFASGLYLPQSDVDLGVDGLPAATKKAKERMLGELAEVIKMEGLVVDDPGALELIASARIPIIRFVDAVNRLPFDITLDASSGVESTDLTREYVRELPHFRYLVLLLKFWLQRRQLHETYSGGVGSFLLQLMVASSLRLKVLSSSRRRAELAAPGNVPSGAAREGSAQGCDETLASSLLDFFELFGVKLNYRTTGISLRHGGSFFPKRSREGWFDADRPGLLSIENPLEPEMDVGKNAYNIHAVRRAMSQSYHAMLAAVRCARRGDDPTRVSASAIAAVFDEDARALMSLRLSLKYADGEALVEVPLEVPPPMNWPWLSAPGLDRADTANGLRLADASEVGTPVDEDDGVEDEDDAAPGVTFVEPSSEDTDSDEDGNGRVEARNAQRRKAGKIGRKRKGMQAPKKAVLGARPRAAVRPATLQNSKPKKPIKKTLKLAAVVKVPRAPKVPGDQPRAKKTAGMHGKSPGRQLLAKGGGVGSRKKLRAGLKTA